MNLYLISQTENEDYDTYDSAVVCAETAAEAKVIHPGDDEEYNLTDINNYKFSWAHPDDEHVKLIGIADKNISKGVV